MPTNLTVKKNDGTTDIVYTAKSGANGTTPAIWQAPGGSAQQHQPELRVSARDTAKGNSRNVRSTYRYPQVATNSTTGVTTVVNVASARTEWDFPKSMSQSDINEFVSQYAYLLVTNLIRDAAKTGFAPV
ncbi:TPA_asm: coat protein [ssRNA phage SRR7976301_8]|uniref:Coat protein n=1 Tax=ssRNA phage SRR7976301_8 TaxID=2786669 RepID=A0A8S5L102_9VIRU|nr:coat protein [ssRNA phage SRR7976301_8]DAD51119.1 TPA_asm: coat protein [ssRNA phage SRR7976301_8]